MKQIFKWLREEIEANSVTVGGADIIGSHMARVLVNQAETKWEKDCCEWEYVGLTENPRYVSAHDMWEVLTVAELWKFCPYCGKKIKIAEVE